MQRTGGNDGVFAWTPPYAVSRTYAVNGLNQYEEIANAGQGAAALQYDGNGNLATDGASTFVYDAENRLLSAAGERNATLSYDPLGRLFQVAGATGTPTQYLYDGDELVAEYNASNTNLLRRYVHGSGDDDPLIWYEGPGGADRRTLLSNHQDSIVAVADASGNAVTVNRYDPWACRAPPMPAGSNIPVRPEGAASKSAFDSPGLHLPTPVLLTGRPKSGAPADGAASC